MKIIITLKIDWNAPRISPKESKWIVYKLKIENIDISIIPSKLIWNISMK